MICSSNIVAKQVKLKRNFFSFMQVKVRFSYQLFNPKTF